MFPLALRQTSEKLDRLQALLASITVLQAVESADFHTEDAGLDSAACALLAQQALALGQAERHLLAVLLDTNTHDPQHQLALIQASFQASRFQDVLELQAHWALCSPEALSLQLASAYRLADWPQVMAVARQLQPQALPFELQRLILRAALELGDTASSQPLLGQLLPHNPPQERQLELLQLLAALMQGAANHEQALQLLWLIHQLEQGELACIARFWPQCHSLAAAAGAPASLLDRLQRRLWWFLARPSILTTAAGALPPCRAPAASWRLGITLLAATPATLQRWQQLQDQLRLQQPELELVPLLLQGGAAISSFPSSSLDLSAKSPWQRLRQLRQAGFDVLLDTVGPSDPPWLLTLAQRVAPIQLAWFDVPLPLPCTSPFDGQLVDRWTLPDNAAADQVPWLSLTGVRQLAPPACRSMSPASTDAERPVGLLVLGAPPQLLSGAALMLQRCLQNNKISGLWFEHPQWREPGVLAHWWTVWLKEPLPPACAPWPGEVAQRLVGVDLCQLSPTAAVFACLAQSLPVVTLPTAACCSRGTASILAAIGLESLVCDQPEEWLEAIGVLASDPDSYQQISSHLHRNLHQSLLFDAELLARDLLAAIAMLRQPKLQLRS